MSEKKRSRIADYLVYLVVRVVVCVVQILSPRQVRGLARFLAWVAYSLDRRHRAVALNNLIQAFGNRYTEAERDRTVRDVYRHFVTMAFEIVRLPRWMHINNWKRYAELHGGEKIVAALLSGRPVLVVTGHLGNWEVAGYALGLFGFTPYAIARPLDNPYADDFLRSFRERTGQRIIAKHGEFGQIEKVLAEGGVLATLADQDAGQRGQFVDFFGKPASTHKAVALLALEHNVPMLVVGVPRLEKVEVDGRLVGCPERYYVVCSDYIDPGEYRDRPDAVAAITQRFTTALEQIVRLAPDQYFWLHRRWKHQPKARTKKTAAREQAA